VPRLDAAPAHRGQPAARQPVGAVDGIFGRWNIGWREMVILSKAA